MRSDVWVAGHGVYGYPDEVSEQGVRPLVPSTVPPPLPNLENFSIGPVGEWVCKGSVIVWWPRPEIRFIALVGRATAADAEFLQAALESELKTNATIHLSCVDIRHVQQIDADAFSRFIEFMSENSAMLTRALRGSIVLHASPVMAATVIGFHQLSGVTFSSAVSGDPRPQLERFGLADADELMAGLEARIALIHNFDLSSRLKITLAKDMGVRQLADYAKELGTSRRTLQRVLRRNGTSFTQEVMRTRIHRAQELLQETSYKLASVAREVGFQHVPSFNAAFKRLNGTTPSHWRLTHRQPTRH